MATVQFGSSQKSANGQVSQRTINGNPEDELQEQLPSYLRDLAEEESYQPFGSPTSSVFSSRNMFMAKDDSETTHPKNMKQFSLSSTWNSSAFRSSTYPWNSSLGYSSYEKSSTTMFTQRVIGSREINNSSLAIGSGAFLNDNIYYSGLLIYRNGSNPNDTIEFLLFNNMANQQRHWSPLKCKLDPREEELTVVLNEFSSMTGIAPGDIALDDTFNTQIKYMSGNSTKKVSYFLAKMPRGVSRIAVKEGYQYAWMTLHMAMEKVQFRNVQDILLRATDHVEPTACNVLKKVPSSKSLGFSILNVSSRSSSLQDLYDSEEVKLSSSQLSQLAQQTQSYRGHPLFKTRLCERFQTEGFCPYGDKCSFAHGSDDLREIPLEMQAGFALESSNGMNFAKAGSVPRKVNPAVINPLYKTKLCEKFMKERFCQYGSNCHFAHGEEQLKQRPVVRVGMAEEEFMPSSQGSNQSRHSNSHIPKKSRSRSGLNGSRQFFDDESSDSDISKHIESLSKASGLEAIDRIVLAIFEKQNNVVETMTTVTEELKEYASSPEQQTAILKSMTSHLPDYPRHLGKCTAIFKFLHDNNIVDDDSILSWYSSVDNTDEKRRGIYLKIQPLIEWLTITKQDMSA